MEKENLYDEIIKIKDFSKGIPKEIKMRSEYIKKLLEIIPTTQVMETNESGYIGSFTGIPVIEDNTIINDYELVF